MKTYVSAGILQKGDRILVCQRPEQSHFGGQWEFPGGKRSEGEDAKECLIRELDEELGLHLDPEKITPLFTLERPETELVMDFMLCAPDDYKPAMNEHNAMAWITLDEIGKYPFCINDQIMLEQVDLHSLFADKK